MRRGAARRNWTHSLSYRPRTDLYLCWAHGPAESLYARAFPKKFCGSLFLFFFMLQCSFLLFLQGVLLAFGNLRAHFHLFVDPFSECVFWIDILLISIGMLATSSCLSVVFELAQWTRDFCKYALHAGESSTFEISAFLKIMFCSNVSSLLVPNFECVC